MPENNPTPLPASFAVYFRSHGGDYRLDRHYATEREAYAAQTRLANRAYQTKIEVSRG